MNEMIFTVVFTKIVLLSLLGHAVMILILTVSIAFSTGKYEEATSTIGQKKIEKAVCEAK